MIHKESTNCSTMVWGTDIAMEKAVGIEIREEYCSSCEICFAVDTPRKARRKEV